MASTVPISYRAQFQPVSQGARGGSNTIKRTVATREGIPHDIMIEAVTSAQIQGIWNYIKLINAGVDTSTVETAITALAP